MIRFLYILLTTAAICSGQPQSRASTIDSIIDSGKGLIGKPYRCTADNGDMLDCSGFVAHIFGKHGIDLPKSAGAIADVCEKIAMDDVQKGDLLFFQGRNKKSKAVGHVTLVIESEDKIRMIHSCNRGVLIDSFPRSYYDERLLFAGRVPDVLADDTTKVKPDTNQVIPDSIVSRTIESIEVEDSTITEIERSTKDTIRLIGVGDIMLGTNFPSSNYLPPQDQNILNPVRDILQSADVTFGNLEGVILSGEGHVKRCGNPANCYAFKSPDHYCSYLKEAGFDVVSLSNNHSNDFGTPGKKNTVRLLEEEGICYAGLLEYPYTTFVRDSITYGFAAFSPNNGTVRINDYERAKEIVSTLDSIADIVIVSFHGGAEGSKYTHITKQTEIFLGENRGNPYEFARLVIDAGADVVFGHGPHVTRAIDLYKDRFIAYSLGNFATYGRFNLRGVNGLAPIMDVKVDAEGKFLEANIIPIKQQGEGGPKVDPDKKVVYEIMKLTAADIPQCDLQITEDGFVCKKPE